MGLIVVSLAACLVSALALFSGFGLGTGTRARVRAGLPCATGRGSDCRRTFRQQSVQARSPGQAGRLAGNSPFQRAGRTDNDDWHQSADMV